VFDYYTPVIVTNEKTAQADPELVKSFYDCRFQGLSILYR
jgi:hypothetical protein